MARSTQAAKRAGKTPEELAQEAANDTAMKLRNLQAVMAANGFTVDADGKWQPPHPPMAEISLQGARSSDDNATNSSDICPKDTGLDKLVDQKLAIVRSKKHKSEREVGMKAVIKAHVKSHLWRRCKIPYGKEEKQEAAEIVLDSLNLVGYDATTPEGKANREKWLEAFTGDVITELNNHRGYVQGNIQKACEAYAAGNGGKMPPKALLKKCFERKIDLNKPNEVEFFEWYWLTLMAQAVGNGKDWSQEKRLYFTISEAAPPATPK